MSGTLAAILGGAAGAVTLVVILIVVLRFCLLRNWSISRTLESNSSDPSLQGGQNVELSLRGGISYTSDIQGAKCFMLEELNLATKNFSDTNLIGAGKFGEVYKGLLPDMIVAIKRRTAVPSQEFIEQVHYISSIRHQNLVRLMGYCQENYLQMLIYDYIPNGSVSTHLYVGKSQASSAKLEFKHRLSIAYGTAKGLEHLHALNPPLVHMDFKTTNVLVDENFTPKVADAGLKNLLDRFNGAGPSSQSMAEDLFLDPEVKESGRFTERSDVYSFGVFLLELVSGREATQFRLSGSDQSIFEWAQSYQDSSRIYDLVDQRMRSSFTTEGVRELLRLTVWCLNPSGQRRPPMNFVVSGIDKILEKERSLTTVMGEGTPTVTLGSQLFTKS